MALHFGHDLERQSASGVRMLSRAQFRKSASGKGLAMAPQRHQPALFLLLRTNYMFYLEFDVGILSLKPSKAKPL